MPQPKQFLLDDSRLSPAQRGGILDADTPAQLAEKLGRIWTLPKGTLRAYAAVLWSGASVTVSLRDGEGFHCLEVTPCSSLDNRSPLPPLVTRDMAGLIRQENHTLRRGREEAARAAYLEAVS